MATVLLIPVITAYNLGIYDELIHQGVLFNSKYQARAWAAFPTIEACSGTIMVDAETPLGTSLLIRFPELKIVKDQADF